MPYFETLAFDNRFTRALPADPLSTNSRRQVQGACYSRVHPTPVHAPKLVAWSPEMAELLGFTPEMVAEVIKPTKERMYSEEEMRACWNVSKHDSLSVGDENYKPIFFKDFIQSLNK